jgi:hypothetical protein
MERAAQTTKVQLISEMAILDARCNDGNCHFQLRVTHSCSSEIFYTLGRSLTVSCVLYPARLPPLMPAWYQVHAAF